MVKTILLIDGDESAADILEYNLVKEGYSVITAYDGEDGLSKALARDIDLIVLDVTLPLMDGFNVCKNVRKSKQAPIVFVSERTEETDKIYAFEHGADDYITKPFSVNEVCARIRAHIRRSAINENLTALNDTTTRLGEIEVDFEKMEVRKNGGIIGLSTKEYDLLCFFITNPGKVFSREELMSRVWEYQEYTGGTRMVDVTIHRLREKIENNPAEPEYIKTRRGGGYFLNLI